MANLVPQLAKKKIAQEYWVRVVTAWFLLATITLLICSVFLFPVYIFTSTQVAVHAESAAAAAESVADYEAVATALERANKEAQLVIEDSRKTRAYDYIALFAALEGQGVTLTSLTFSKQGDVAEPIELEGVADDRESLAAFRDRLLAAEAIESVDLPISNLAKESNITFDMTIKITKDTAL